MGGVRLLLVAAIAAASVLCVADGWPQTVNQRSEGFPVKSFSQPERRHGHEGVQHSSSQPVRPFSQAEDSSQGLPVRPFNQRAQESLPVRPFNEYDSRGGTPQRVASRDGENHGRQPSVVSQPVRPFSQSESSGSSGDNAGRPRDHQRHEEDPYQSRAHSTPLSAHVSSEKERQPQQRHQSDNRRKDETPNWSTGQVRLDSQHSVTGGHSGGQHFPSSNTPLLRDNRRTTSQQEQQQHKVKPVGVGSRGQQGGGVADRGSSVRMGGGAEGSAAKEGGGGGEQGKSAAEEGIVFPGPTGDAAGKGKPGKFTPPVGVVGPNCAQGSTFCETPETYPSEYLKSVLQNEAEGLREFFGNDVLSNDTTLVQRIDAADENPLCQSVEQVVYPKMAQNKEDKWLYVVNQDQYIQGVRVEKCLKPESECLLTKSFPLGYKTICRQKYIYRRMLALNDDGKALSDTFRLPSCCSCFVKSVAGGERKR